MKHSNILVERHLTKSPRNLVLACWGLWMNGGGEKIKGSASDADEAERISIPSSIVHSTYFKRSTVY